jgi:hypothetical protein
MVAVAALGIGIGCGQAARESPWHDPRRDSPELSSVRLNDPWAEGSAADFLGPQEREAVSESGASWTDEEVRLAMKESAKPEPESGFGKAADQAGKVGVTLMGVGITVAAVVAPFFLF